MHRITDRQQELYGHIVAHFRKFGCAPTYRELVSAMGYKSNNSIASHLKALETKGLILIRRGKGIRARSIRLVVNNGKCPVCGSEKKTTDIVSVKSKRKG